MFLHQAKRELELLIGLYRLAIAEFNKSIAECNDQGEDSYMFVEDRDKLEEMLKGILSELSIVKCLLNN